MKLKTAALICLLLALIFGYAAKFLYDLSE